MILNLYTIYDAKAEAYHQPFYAQSRGVAIRMFTEAANDKNTSVGKYPSDFTLFELGYFDDSDCEFKLHDAKIPLGMALEYVTQQPFETTRLANGAKLKTNGDSVEYTYPGDTE